MTGESLVNFLSRLTTDATANIVLSQGAMVILTVFGGGLFIPWNSTPIYWVWLQELSFLTQSSRAAIMEVMNFVEYKCATMPFVGCVSDFGIFPCDALPPSVDGFCYVKGRTVMNRLQGSSNTDSPWIAFGYLVLIFVTLRFGILLLMYYPVDRISALFKQFWSNGVDEQILKGIINLRRLEG